MIMIWALNLSNEKINTPDLILNSWPNINCNSCMECNLEENVPLEIVCSDQITRTSQGPDLHTKTNLYFTRLDHVCVCPRSGDIISTSQTLHIAASTIRSFQFVDKQTLEHLTQHWQWQSQTRRLTTTTAFTNWLSTTTAGLWSKGFIQTLSPQLLPKCQT